MKYIYISIISCLFALCLKSQNLGKGRIERLKSSVCRILIDNQASGTGFFVSNNLIATCFHVIKPALFLDQDTKALSSKKIEAEFQNGEKIEIKILDSITSSIDWILNAQGFDFCILKTTTNSKIKVKPFKIANYKEIEEGDIIYSCGYPLGIPQQFISKGVLSTKWLRPFRLKNTMIDTTFQQEVSWSDITSNKGCSGSPIIKWGLTENDDKIVAISSFGITPLSNKIDSLNDYISKLPPNYGTTTSGLFITDVYSLLANALSLNSIGVSGCISIDYLNYYLKKANK